MDIKTNSLFAQMQSMSLEATGIKPNALPQVNSSTNDFGNLLKDAVESVNALQKDAGAKKTAFELGDPKVSLGEAMIATQKAGIAFDATVQVRNKFVEAYKEIMNMPV